MFTALVRWFGSQQERPARTLAGLTFSLRLEDLEGRAAPRGLSGNGIPAVDTEHVGEEIPQTGTNAIIVGVDLCGSKLGIASGSNEMALGGDTAIQIDPTGGGKVGSDFGVGVDLAGGHSTSGDFLYGVQVGSAAVPAGQDGESGISIDPIGSKGGGIEW
jgi:hypothetical protein